jgi:hypothetical protein
VRETERERISVDYVLPMLRMGSRIGAAYEFDGIHDDAARVFVDGQTTYDVWSSPCCVVNRRYVYFTAGTKTVIVEFREDQGGASIAMSIRKLCPLNQYAVDVYDNRQLNVGVDSALIGNRVGSSCTATPITDYGAGMLSWLQLPREKSHMPTNAQVALAMGSAPTTLPCALSVQFKSPGEDTTLSTCLPTTARVF